MKNDNNSRTQSCLFIRSYLKGFLILLLLAISGISPVRAQETSDTGRDIRLFLDCDECDFSFFRRNIEFVDYVRDPELADVHLLVTRQFTASRGRNYRLNFIGKGAYEGLAFQLEFQTMQSDTESQRRDKIVQQVSLGLMPYVAYTNAAQSIAIGYDAEMAEGREDSLPTIKDPWNYWVFRVGGGGRLDAQESQNSFSIDGFFRIERITEMWKIRTRFFYDYNEDNFDDNGEKITAVRTFREWENDLVRSLNDHWSVGFFTSVYSSSFRNIDYGFRITPAIEYNFWPWDASDRKVFTTAYSVGIRSSNYTQTTIFDQDEETRFYESLRVQLILRQPWGELESELEGLHYFHDLSKYRIIFDNNLFLRVTNGLSFSVGLEMQSVHDQLYLPKGNATLEEILLQQRQLATTFEISARLGIRYTFGSIYNNVVNPRF